jgi:hypothetical protein
MPTATPSPTLWDIGLVLNHWMPALSGSAGKGEELALAPCVDPDAPALLPRYIARLAIKSRIYSYTQALTLAKSSPLCLRTATIAGTIEYAASSTRDGSYDLAFDDHKAAGVCSQHGAFARERASAGHALQEYRSCAQFERS